MHTLTLAACTTSTSILVRPLRIALLLACSMQETNTKRTELAGRDAITSGQHEDEELMNTLTVSYLIPFVAVRVTTTTA